MKATRTALFLTVTAACVGLLAACSTSAPAANTPAAGEKPQITLVTGGQSLDFYTTMACGAKAAAKKENVDLTVQGPANYSLPESLQVLNAVIQTKPQGVLLVPVDPTGLNASVTTLTSQGTTVVTADGQLSKKLDVANFRSDNIAGGKAAADALGAALGGKGTVAQEGLAPSAVYNAQRLQGFQEEMKAKYPDIVLLPPQYNNGDKNVSSQNISAQLQSHPELNGVFGAQQTAGEGAVAAVAAAGKTGQVKVVAYDADPSQVQGLRSGAYVALVAQSPYAEGEKGVTLLAQLLRGKVKKSDVTYQQFTPVKAITKDNVDDADVKEFLYTSSCS